jgi:hypothetical protein
VEVPKEVVVVSSPSRNRWAVVLATAGLVVAATAVAAPAEAKSSAPAKPAHPYEAIAGHYPTMAQADAVANKARAKGFTAVVQVNGPKHIEVEYGNGYTTPGPALALCKKVKAAGLPCLLGQEQHGVPADWSHPSAGSKGGKPPGRS